MPIVTRLLDAFFRTLDAVDAARERLDRALGRTPEPIVTSWDANPPAPLTDTWAQKAPSAEWPGAAPSKPPKDPAPTKARAKPAQKGSAGRKKAAKKASRKGSVDRTGAEVDSPRARAILEKLRSDSAPVVAEAAVHDGKKVLARVLWALHAAEAAGSEQGLTAADASALLHLAAGIEVFATNIARACRDETALITEGALDGRSKRYRLTAAGRIAAEGLDTQALA